jgi:hypothetical protein
MALMSLLCSFVASNVNIQNPSDPIQASILKVCSELAPLEPEFILKVLWGEGGVGVGSREVGNVITVCEGGGDWPPVGSRRNFT